MIYNWKIVLMLQIMEKIKSWETRDHSQRNQDYLWMTHELSVLISSEGYKWKYKIPQTSHYANILLI